MIKYLTYFFSLLLLLSCDDNENGKFKRLISEYNLDEIKHFEHSYGQAIRMYVQNNIISISNSPKFQIFQYNLDGQLIKTLTKPGGAPWESHALWHFSFSGNGSRYWVHDYDKQMLKCYDYKKDSMILYRKEITQGNVHLLDDNRFIIPRTDCINNKYFFSIYDIKNQKYVADISLNDSLNIKSTIVNKRDLSMYLLSGGFSSYNMGDEILYYMYNVGRFIIMNKKTLSFKIFKDVHNQPIPTAYLKNGIVHLSNKNSIITLSGAIDNKYVYLLSPKDEPVNVKLRSADKFFIDVYEKHNGKYLKSINVPLLDDGVIPMRIAISEKRLIISYDNQEIYIYNFDNSIVGKL
ncbi:MAG: hypothetical protein H7339_07720 [Arcicella sp.]|nr:hypothetical protein [Arcicella sp.]